jgi:hypothetical protein
MIQTPSTTLAFVDWQLFQVVGIAALNGFTINDHNRTGAICNHALPMIGVLI